jgi:hypothetical protein
LGIVILRVVPDSGFGIFDLIELAAPVVQHNHVPEEDCNALPVVETDTLHLVEQKLLVQLDDVLLELVS